MFSGYTLILEIILTVIIYIKTDITALITLLNSLFATLFLFVIMFVGIFKTVLKSKQIKVIWYIFLFFGWYIPILNIVIFRYFYKTGRREFYFEMSRLEIENARAKNSVCNTKYPILMVHGIFFRDWQFFNYWGRIPEALITNGARIYYGNQQSAKSIEKSADELKDRILEVIAETGAKKVNIIAHSKGGLDSRYAISKLGMDKYVASLITINTPHNGCDFVENLLKTFPKGIVNFIAGKYNSIFSKLGDNSPDFLAGVEDLKSSSCKIFNENVPDSPYVYYESYMSEMQNFFSAGIPLNIGYLFIKKCNGKSDGLVWVESARHGENFTLIKNKYRRGISHGDMIDLFRENIKGFDVREFYVDITKKLKQKGF
ncbi:MAG: triacylglycerol lipase [Oscillospiraceae bacterium]|nr:triacylglycerol lipase [Oscillospiraceae bacterium]